MRSFLGFSDTPDPVVPPTMNTGATDRVRRHRGPQVFTALELAAASGLTVCQVRSCLSNLIRSGEVQIAGGRGRKGDPTRYRWESCI